MSRNLQLKIAKISATCYNDVQQTLDSKEYDKVIMNTIIYSIQELKNIVVPIAIRHGLKAVYLFGSYARECANQDSDVDLIVDTDGSDIKSLLDLSGLYCEFEDALGKSIDLITLNSIMQKPVRKSEITFKEIVLKERIGLYVAA